MNFRGIKVGERARGLTAGARKPEEEGQRKGEGSWGGMDGGGVSGVIMDTRRSTVSRGVQGPGGSAGAAGGVTAGARSGGGNDGSGGRRCGWRREGGGVGDAADGSSTTPYNILREGGGRAGRERVDRGGGIWAWRNFFRSIGPGRCQGIGRGWEEERGGELGRDGRGRSKRGDYGHSS